MYKVHTCWSQCGKYGYVFLRGCLSEEESCDWFKCHGQVIENWCESIKKNLKCKHRIFILVLTLSSSDDASELFCFPFETQPLCVVLVLIVAGTVYIVNVSLLLSNPMDQFKPNVTRSILRNYNSNMFK